MLALLCAVFSSAWGQTTTGTIYFGPNATTINSSNVIGTDNLNNTWTITTEGTNSFTNSSGQNYSQVGSKNNPATKISFTTTLSLEQTITAFSAKFSGNSKSEGIVTLKIGDNQVGTGNINETNEVTVESTTTVVGKTLTVTVTDIARAINCFYISYTIDGDVPTHTVTYVCDDNTSQYTYGENATINLANAPTKEGCFFIGWSDGTTTYDAGASYTVTQDVTFTAQWSKGTETWVKTDLANLTESDVFVFVGKRDGNYYAMDNSIDTNTNPQAVSVTVSDNEETLVGTVAENIVAENIKWNIENATGGYYFHPNGSNDYYLASAGSTDLRVGNYSDKTFKLADNNYLMNNDTGRYLCVFIGTGNNPRKDWRAYTSTNIIANQTFAFYKKVIDLAEISLNENEDNTTAISENNETRVNVNLTRTLFGGMWNAICLPFAMTDAQRTTLFGANYVLQEMSSAELDANGTAQLYFTKVDASAPTVAGTPYLVKPIQDVTSAVINDVKIVKATNGKPAPVENNGYKFQGIYNPTALADMGADPENILFLGRGSQLLTPSTDSKPMKGFRAYFILNSSNGASGLSLTTEDGGIINSISLAEVDGLYTNMDNNRVYSISGQYIGTKTEGLAKGIYIVNGRKFIVK